MRCLMFVALSFLSFSVLQSTILIARDQAEMLRIMRRIRPGRLVRLDPKRYSAIASSVFSGLRKFSARYLKRRGFQAIAIKNDEGYVTHGFLALPKKKRPLLVCIAGIGSGPRATVLRICGSSFRRRYPMGVLLLENPVSAGWQKRNHRAILSGYETGWDLYLNLRKIREKYQYLVAEIHVVGLSLGGSDATYAAYFDSILGTRVLTSVLAISAPANRLKTIVHGRSSKSIWGVFFRQLVAKKMYTAMKSFLANPVTTYQFLKGLPFDTLVQRLYLSASRDYFKTQRHHLKKGLSDIYSQGALEVSGFKKMLTLDAFLPAITTPVFYLNARNDGIAHAIHTQRVFKRDTVAKHFGYRIMRWGGHMGFRDAYGLGWTRRTILRYVQYWGNLPKGAYESRNWEFATADAKTLRSSEI